MENNNHKFVIKVSGKEVEVTEEVYRAYVRPKAKWLVNQAVNRKFFIWRK